MSNNCCCLLILGIILSYIFGSIIPLIGIVVFGMCCASGGSREQPEYVVPSEIQQKEINPEIIGEKIKKLAAVSKKTKLSMLRNVLEMDQKTFDSNIIDWAMDFGFVIDGENIIFEDADINGFIENLDKQFELWHKQEKNGYKSRI